MANLSEPSRKRLLSLLLLLRQQGDGSLAGEAAITSRHISRLTGWTDATIRRDISQLGIRCGGAAKGYPIRELQAAIERIFGAATQGQASHRCCIVGLGKLGAALLDDSELAAAGFQLVAGFDESVNRVELLEASFPLHPASRLEQVIRQESIVFALLTVPDTVAAAYGKRLAQAGIRGIVNYTNVLLTLPPQLRVENVSAIHSLRQLAAGSLLQNE